MSRNNLLEPFPQASCLVLSSESPRAAEYRTRRTRSNDNSSHACVLDGTITDHPLRTQLRPVPLPPGVSRGLSCGGASSGVLTSLHIIEGHTDISPPPFASAPDGQRITCSAAMTKAVVRLWDASSGRSLHVLEGHRGKVASVCFSSDGLRIASHSGVEIVVYTAGSTIAAGWSIAAVLRSLGPHVCVQHAEDPSNSRTGCPLCPKL